METLYRVSAACELRPKLGCAQPAHWGRRAGLSKTQRSRGSRRACRSAVSGFRFRPQSSAFRVSEGRGCWIARECVVGLALWCVDKFNPVVIVGFET